MPKPTKEERAKRARGAHFVKNFLIDLYGTKDFEMSYPSIVKAFLHAIGDKRSVSGENAKKLLETIEQLPLAAPHFKKYIKANPGRAVAFAQSQEAKTPCRNALKEIRKANAVAQKLREDFYASREWRSLRYDVLKESNGKCCLCGRSAKDGVVLHIDHIKPRSLHPELELVKSNMQVLCQDCNLGKSNKDSINWSIQ